MAKNLWLKRFTPDGVYVARRVIAHGANVISAGERIPSDFTARRLRQMYDSRVILYADVAVEHGLALPEVLSDVNTEPVAPVAPVVTEPVVEPVVTEPVVLPEILTPAENTGEPLALPDLLVEQDELNRDVLLEKAMFLGVKVDGRWSDKRLAEEVEKAENGKPA